MFRLEFISNQEFTEPEFLKWKDTILSHDITLPSLDLVESKMKDIKEAMIYEFKEEDIEKVGIILIHSTYSNNNTGQHNFCNIIENR